MPTQRVLKLREHALHSEVREPFAKTIIEAETWRAGGSKAKWLIWRARRTAALLERLPIEIGPDELLVGRVEMRSSNTQEAERLKWAQEVLKEAPPWPGGDTSHFAADHEKLLRL
ncbi:MAG: hypothetical protein KAJ05_05045, partial [Candidatus Latescibacteria bacterium]|nr:hypothetical protein [Candidatus Latescibacterota bacterium]